MKISLVKPERERGGNENEHEPGQVSAINDPHSIKVPSSKLQAPEKRQTSIPEARPQNVAAGDWVIGTSLVLGGWCLVLPRSVRVMSFVSRRRLPHFAD